MLGKRILTEKSNDNTKFIDLASSLEIVKLMNNEDQLVAQAVEKELIHIAKAIDLIYSQINKGGSLLYFGAGTSGRLGILDASECPPTFGADPSLVRAYIAGGDFAIKRSVEGAEDSFETGQIELQQYISSSDDIIVGISVSGKAPYVCGVLSKAKSIGLKTIALSCNPDSEIANFADIHIAPVVGPEVVSGSSRLKAGTSHKMVLNMLSTGTMIKLGKTYYNYMIDVVPSNSKLIDRAIRIIVDITGVSYNEAKEYLVKADNNVKLATTMILKQIDKNFAEELLSKHNGKLREVLSN